MVGSDLSVEQKNEMASLISEFRVIFSDKPGKTNLVSHRILLSDDTPIRVRPYPIPFAKADVFEKEVRKMLDLGIIEFSSSPFRSPMLLVKKSDATYRPVIDYRAINKVTRFDAEPIPNPEAIFAKLS